MIRALRTSGWGRFTEAVTIVGSILLAFAIDAWWQRQGEVRVEREMISAMGAEVELNRMSLLPVIEEHEAILDRIDRFMRSSPEALATTPEDSVLPMVAALPNGNAFNPVLETSRTLAEATVLTPSGVEARSMASASVRLWDEVHEDDELFRELRANVRIHLASYAVAGAAQGRSWLGPMVAREGAEVLAALRQDVTLMQLLIHKAHAQATYVMELRQWLETLDALGAALAPTE